MSTPAPPGPLKRWASRLWIAAWCALAAHCLLSSHGRPPLTNPIPGESHGPAPLSFVALGDCHSHTRSLRGFLQAAADHQAAFALQLGDFTDYDEDLDYHFFVRRLRGLSHPPLYLVRGNHEAVDFSLAETDRYLRYIPRPSYSLVTGDLFLLVLDNAHGELAPETLAFARTELRGFRAGHRSGPVVVAMHVPPTMPQSGCTDLDQTSSAAFLDLCREFGVDVVLSGHLHRSLEYQADGTTFIIDGCGGGSLGAPSESVHCLLFSVAGGRLTWEKLPLPRDRPVVARLDYLLNVALLRYRWFVVAVALFFIGREALALRVRPGGR